MQEDVSLARRDTGPMVEETTQLLTRRWQLQTKQRLLGRILARFTISVEDRDILTSSEEPVDDRFFRLLTDTKTVHQDCQVFLGSESQTLGLDVMEQSSRILHAAFEKLYRWILGEFRRLDLESPQMSSSIRRGLYVLAERPALFQSCLEFFAESRERILSEAFFDALTGPSNAEERSTARPIELSAHDPLRYVGDMLAWTHSTAVSEREALEVLFTAGEGELGKGVQAGLENDPWERSKGEAAQPFDGRKVLNDLVHRSLSGVAKVMKQRVEQILSSYEEPTAFYKLANLITFYQSTLERLLGGTGPIVETLNSLGDLAHEHFRTLMKDSIIDVQAEPADIPFDLGLPAFFGKALTQLTEIMKSYDMSLAPVSDQEAGFQPVLDGVIDPFLLRFQEMANDLEQPRRSIFILNCLWAIKNALTTFSFTSESVKKIDTKIGEQIQILVDYQHDFFLHESGLQVLIIALESVPDTEAGLSLIKGLSALDPQSLIAISQRLDGFLPSAVLDARENLKLLQHSKVVYEITDEAAERFCDDFELVEQKISAVDELSSKQASERDDAEEDEEEEEGEKKRWDRHHCGPSSRELLERFESCLVEWLDSLLDSRHLELLGLSSSLYFYRPQRRSVFPTRSVVCPPVPKLMATPIGLYFT